MSMGTGVNPFLYLDKSYIYSCDYCGDGGQPLSVPERRNIVDTVCELPHMEKLRNITCYRSLRKIQYLQAESHDFLLQYKY